VWEVGGWLGAGGGGGERGREREATVFRYSPCDR